MQKKFDIVGVIPARFASSRFPGKPLIDIAGVPLIIRVCRKVEEALGNERTFVATDDQRIANIVDSYGYNYVMTRSDHKTGTDRIFEFSSYVDAEIYLNIQGDEPLIDPNDIIRIAEAKRKYQNFIINGYTDIDLASEDPYSINIPKVIINQHDELIYMSRLAIPGSKNNNRPNKYYKQVCIYAFNKAQLKIFGERKEKTFCESYEDIEILRYIELGERVKMVKTNNASLAVDVPEDIKRIEDFLERSML